ncbi:hypothetical protein B0O80DRAFT_111103 [Mortierella sp. GBAus27b]|nr:hypothetical protein B0O80DRAFT_111103 [Mortierella sp. GBAus27b]
MESPVFRKDRSPGDPSTLPISRLAWSKDSTFLAALALWKDTAYVTVWDMKDIGDLSTSSADISILHQNCSVATVKYQGDLQELSIGLAISPEGDQVVLYQEPKVGQWTDGSKLDRSTFKFTLLYTVNQPGQLALMVDPDDSSGSYTGISSGKNHPNQLLRLDRPPHIMLRNFVGYGAYLRDTESNDWDTSDVKAPNTTETPQYDNDSSSSTHSDDDKERSTTSALFVTCNGIYIDIFKVTPTQFWENSHSISLMDLPPTPSRRTTCQTMMDLITRNTFMWLADDGRCCTIWDLQSGLNVSYIASAEETRHVSSVFRGESKVAISADESIVAMASPDGILTTHYTSSGIEISNRKFRNHQIEHIAFHGQNSQLFVILRDSATLKLSSWIFDPLLLVSEMQANQVPIPETGKTILTFFCGSRLKNKGLICETAGSNINIYVTHESVKCKVPRGDTNLVDSSGVLYPLQNTHAHNEQTEQPQVDVQDEAIAKLSGQSYEVRSCANRELFRDGEGSMYWVHRVEVVEKNLARQHEEVIFSFLPEPWMRVSAAEVRRPQKLLKVYFLPGSKRFVVNGMQTIQIWSLPTDEDPDFHLVFIWSQPRTTEDKDMTTREKKYKTEFVGKYYHRIVDLHIYLDRDTDHAVANIELRDGTKHCGVVIPGGHSGNTHIVFVHCIRSIHLLAAAYAYSSQGTKSSTEAQRQRTLTFEKHAKAIARFACGHINRIILSKDLYPRKSDQEQDQERGSNHIPPMGISSAYRSMALQLLSNGDLEMPQTLRRMFEIAARNPVLNPFIWSSKSVPARYSVTTIISLLLDQVDLADVNHIFVEGLISTTGSKWIPHANVLLNPIKHTIHLKNESLLRIMIDYCVRCTKTTHPGYMESVEQCISELLDRYPEIAADIFVKASYIPVHNQGYVRAHAVESSSIFMYFSNYMNTEPNSEDIFNNDKLMFTSRLQLSTAKGRMRETSFPERHQKKPLQIDRSRTIYVSPFQFKPVERSVGGRKGKGGKGSVLDRIAERDLFDNPVIGVTLKYRWKTFGLPYWLNRFLYVLSFSILVLTITIQQIHVSTTWQGSEPTVEEIEARYLPQWRPVFILTAVMGIVLIFYELLQFIYSPRKYIMSIYNFVDLAAYVSPVVWCFLFLKESSAKNQDDTGIDRGPKQIWAMGFVILALYLNLLFELRVFKPLGIVVNVILNIGVRIKWFFLVFAVFLVSFTHGFLYVLHTRRYRSCQNGSCDGTDYPSSYPTGFWPALSATYFFLGGRYDPIDNSLDNGSVSFHVMMVIFYFFTVIILLNVLIALMNDAFTVGERGGEFARLKVLCEVISGLENYTMTDGARRRVDYFPKYIYYCASEEEITNFRSKYSLFDDTNLTPEGRFLLSKSSETVSKVEAIRDKMDALGDDLKAEVRQEIAELRELVKTLLVRSGESTSPTKETVSRSG